MVKIVDEEVLKKKYYPVYTTALKMLLNPSRVTDRSIEKMMAATKESPLSPMSKMFGIVVREETSRTRIGKPSMDPSQYKEAVYDAWRLFKDYAVLPESDAYWDEVVDRVHDIMKKHGNSALIKGLVVDVTLEELENLHRKTA